MFSKGFVFMLFNLAFSQAFEAPRNGFFKREFSLSKPYTSKCFADRCVMYTHFVLKCAVCDRNITLLFGDLC